MATNKVVVRKNGYPVKRFWQERINKKTRAEYYTTTYPVYFGTFPGDGTWSLTDGAAPTTLQEALEKARVLVEATDTPQTSATIYEMRALYRLGTEFDWPRHKAEQSAVVREFNTQREPDYARAIATATANTGNTPE